MTTDLGHLTRGAMVGVALVATAAFAWGAERTGREVVSTVCSSIHADGKDGSPKIGDFAVWASEPKEAFTS
jgi:cytochrome c5